MILWVILFLLVVGISFVLAYRSMKDYQEIPKETKAEYGLFLIRQTTNFDSSFLDSIQKLIAGPGLVVSLERLFKGQKAALTIFGPKQILAPFTYKLDLLELEDYTLNLDSQKVAVWEVGLKSANPKVTIFDNIFQNLPQLQDQDQFFWQVVLGAKLGKDSLFQTQIRAAVYSENPLTQKELVSSLQNFSFGGLIKVPRPFSTQQIMNFYESRSLSKDSKGPVLNSEGVIRLLKV